MSEDCDTPESLSARVAALEQQTHQLRALLSALNLQKLSTLNPAQVLQDPLGPVADFLGQYYDDDSLNGATLEQPIAAYAANDSHPLPALEDREHYYPNQELDYWLSGLRDYLRIREQAGRLGTPLSGSSAVFELGAASARAARHFIAHEPERPEVVVCDVNRNHVAWVNRHLPGINAFQNSTFPVLPIEDRRFDVVCAFSVFTHSDELEEFWLMELHRILKRGGMAYLTVQSERVWHYLADGDQPYPIEFRTLDGQTETRHAPYKFLFNHLRMNQHILPDWQISPELFANPMPTDKVTFAFNNGVVYNTCTFHSLDYIKREWGRIFEFIDFLPAASSFQDAIVLRKR
jgi:SAM-dependent methyltransferase